MEGDSVFSRRPFFKLFLVDVFIVREKPRDRRETPWMFHVEVVTPNGFLESLVPLFVSGTMRSGFGFFSLAGLSHI